MKNEMRVDPLNLIGKTIDKYLIVDYLATGGTAHIYKARWHEQFVVMKLLREDMLSEPDIRQRLHKEAYALTQVEHPHVIKLLDDGRYNNLPYLIFEYVEIGSLKDYIESEDNNLTLGDIAIIIGQIADALNTLHENNFIHRDVKPGNIMMRDRHNAALADFGIVRNEDSISRYGVQPGTLDFMAPEQLNGVKADFTTDQFALGVVAFQTLTGKRPFVARNRQEALRQREKGIPSAHSINPDLPLELDAILQRAMHCEMAQRYTLIEKFARDIAGLIKKYGLEDYPAPGTSTLARVNTRSDTEPFKKHASSTDNNIKLESLMRPYAWVSVGILCTMLAVILIYISVPSSQASFPPTPGPDSILADLIKITDTRDDFNCSDFMYLYNKLYTQVRDANPEFSHLLTVTDDSSATKIIYIEYCAVSSQKPEDSISGETWQSMRDELQAVQDN